jgi:NTP pyrophosphatase (non-canonical NTP hydrolase)
MNKEDFDFDGYDFDHYQELCSETDLGDIGGRQILEPSWMYYVLGIGGETGELLEKIKKLFRDGNGMPTWEQKKEILKEMGDVSWYMARLCDVLGMPYSDVAKLNIEKLFSRKEREQLQGDGDNR